MILLSQTFPLPRNLIFSVPHKPLLNAEDSLGVLKRDGLGAITHVFSLEVFCLSHFLDLVFKVYTILLVLINLYYSLSPVMVHLSLEVTLVISL